MILPFSTHWPKHMGDLAGKPTHFIDKIWQGLHGTKSCTSKQRHEYNKSYFEKFSANWGFEFVLQPKIHTLREDINDRWRTGVNIDFFINSRTKNMFRFAPKLPVVSTQDVFMTMIHGRFEITIDDTYLYYPEKLQLAQNDGFKSVEEFERFFFPDGGKTKWEKSLKLIHWTKLRYNETPF